MGLQQHKQNVSLLLVIFGRPPDYVTAIFSSVAQTEGAAWVQNIMNIYVFQTALCQSAALCFV